MVKPSHDLARLLGPDARRTPGMQALWERILKEDAGLPDAATLPITEGRALQSRIFARWNHDMPEVAEVLPFSVTGLDGAHQIRCELITPPAARKGIILFLHGGGWAFGDLVSHQRFMRVLALETKMRVLGVDYRLAPEHPYPAGLDDAVAVWRWLISNRADDPQLAGPTAVAGDSAGANLALALMLREQEAGREIPQTALLFYGAYAADLDSPSYQRFAEGFGLTRARMATFWKWYAPALNEGETARDPHLQPVLASASSLARLPKLYLNAASLDPLLCDSFAMMERLDDAGTPYEFVLHEGVHHGFMQMTAFLEEARAAFRPVADFVSRQLHGGA